MTKFKVGDKVKIRSDSMFYDGNKNNPKDTVGEVSNVNHNILPIKVEWPDGRESYNEKDLELITEFVLGGEYQTRLNSTVICASIESDCVWFSPINLLGTRYKYTLTGKSLCVISDIKVMPRKLSVEVLVCGRDCVKGTVQSDSKGEIDWGTLEVRGAVEVGDLVMIDAPSGPAIVRVTKLDNKSKSATKELTGRKLVTEEIK